VSDEQPELMYMWIGFSRWYHTEYPTSPNFK